MSTDETLTKQKWTGMRVLKWLFITLGIVGLAFCVYFLVRTAFDMRQVMGYANSNKSQEVTSPMPLFYWAVGLAGAGGLLLGMGIAMPRRTARAIKAGVPLSTQVTRPAKFADTAEPDRPRDSRGVSAAPPAEERPDVDEDRRADG